MEQFDTVVAISTPRAQGGISVIRISGENALAAADCIFSPLSRKEKPSQMQGYTCAYGFFLDSDGNRIDDGILTVFRTPHSYTGEDVVELSCHGGIYVTDKLLRRIYECDVSPAGAGEFTKRAFLNGKMSLTQAEAVADIISAQGDAFCRTAVSIKDGSTYRETEKLSQRLITVLGAVAAWIDYPEEDIDEITPKSMRAELSDISLELKKISATYDRGRILRQGIKAVIAGKPNAGKSTLMNLLCGCERSIVTDIAGTTRDVIEETVRLGDILLRLSDTAGIRTSSDVIEQAGIDLAYRHMEQAELIIAVFDGSVPLNEYDFELISRCKALLGSGTRVIACINKCDKETICEKKIIYDSFQQVVEISAKNNSALDTIQTVLTNMYMTDSIDNITQTLIVNERQKLCIDMAAARIDEALTALDSGITLDAVNVVLDEAENALLKLNGQKASEEVVNEVFSHFCVGK